MLQQKVAANPAGMVPAGVTSVAQLAPAVVVKFLSALPQVSRPFIDNWFRKNPETKKKSDQSPVTIADQKIEAALRDVITTVFPDDAIQGEEFGVSDNNESSRFCWVIDPIDGTKAFISGKPIFGTLVGVTDRGVPCAGMIDMPILKETYVGHVMEQNQFFCQMNGAMLRPSNCMDMPSARIATTSPLALSASGLTGFNQLAEQAAVTNYGGDCHNYALLAAGHLDLVLEDSLAPHDMMAVVAVMRASGATVTDIDGLPILRGQSNSILAAATPDLHGAALAVLAKQVN